MNNVNDNVDSNSIAPGAENASVSLGNTALLFALGGFVTAFFSASLVVIAKHASLAEVLVIGMVVPSFTWVVHLAASAVLLPEPSRKLYWNDLSRVCYLGSVALLPAAFVNLLTHFSICPAMLWLSAVNVLLSVLLMAIVLFRRCAPHQISVAWPVAWCCTITVNMGIFLWVSRNWW